jgi:hypothetical protein
MFLFVIHNSKAISLIMVLFFAWMWTSMASTSSNHSEDNSECVYLLVAALGLVFICTDIARINIEEYTSSVTYQFIFFKELELLFWAIAAIYAKFVIHPSFSSISECFMLMILLFVHVKAQQKLYLFYKKLKGGL